MPSGLNDNNPPPTAPTFNPFSIDNNAGNFNSNDVLNRFSQEQQDELLARRLQEEENSAAASRRGQTRAANNSQPTIVQATTVPYPESINNSTAAYPHYTYKNNATSNMPSGQQIKTDAEMARKVEREMNDEIYARQLQEYERRRGAARVHAQPTNRSGNNRNNRQVRSPPSSNQQSIGQG